ncbi:alpha/beta fold hydrolase [Jannaschia pohangensis]|uniref:alpha/beta fold hydrolase n=1 Tax=Jannaschia pohangensis TaxID=390807 RepID=UPI001587F6E7|nr:alpha/beta fold hydrolase [Jannaschia pohangensis]
MVILIGGLIWLVAISAGRSAPLRDEAGQIIPGSLSDRVTVDIGGIPQTMIIQSVDPANPVLLFLHGGPGMTEFFMELEYPTGLEQHFTMVWWEQRGAGMSFSADIPPETMTMERMIADTVEVADYLRTRFGQDRIVLLGHSWGSYLGVQVAAAAPDRFLAYVGMAQIALQLRSEVMAHDALLDTYRARGDTAMVRRLEASPVSMEAGTSPEWMQLRDTAMHRAGAGHTHDMTSVITGIFLPMWRVRAYTLMDKINVRRGKIWSRPFFWDRLLRDNLSARRCKVKAETDGNRTLDDHAVTLSRRTSACNDGDPVGHAVARGRCRHRVEWAAQTGAMRWAIAIAAALLAMGQAVANAQAGPDAVGPSLREIATARMARDGVAGTVIVLLQHGRLLRTVAFGTADPATGRVMGENIPFPVEPLSKPVTAWAAIHRPATPV